MLNLDPKTLITILALGGVMSFVLFFLYSVFYKIKDQILNFYILGKVFQSITWILFLVFADHLNSLMMIVTNFFLYAGFSLETYCLTSLYGKENKNVYGGFFYLA